MAYRSTQHENTGNTPNMLMLGRVVHASVDIMYEVPNRVKPTIVHDWVKGTATNIGRIAYICMLNYKAIYMLPQRDTMIRMWLRTHFKKAIKLKYISLREELLNLLNYQVTGTVHNTSYNSIHTLLSKSEMIRQQ